MKHACKEKPSCNRWLQTVITHSLFSMLGNCRMGTKSFLKGSVSDTKGEPIIGASVVVKGNTTQGTITDLDGQFTLNAFNSTLVISYIGYVTQEIPAKGTVKVTLKEDNEMLDEGVCYWLWYTA